MEYDTFSHRHGLIITENNVTLNEQWLEITETLGGITDEEIISRFESRGENRGKGIQNTLNNLIKEKLVEHYNWDKESKIFNEIPYINSNEAGMKYFRLDFAKNKDCICEPKCDRGKHGMSIEVSFNHREALAWNLLKPSIASELNHVKKAFQTDIGVLITPKDEMLDLDRNNYQGSGLDGAIGTFELVKKYLKVLQIQLSCPMIIIGIHQPKSFYIDTSQETHNGGKLGTVVKRSC